MSNPWFRMYSEFSHDPKVQMLSEVMQRRYVMIMCLRCSNSLETLHETELAFHLRISDADLAETKATFIKKGFIDSSWNLLNWDKRQFASDSSKARVAKHRALLKEKQNDTGNCDVTLQKRQSNALDTEQIQNRTEKKKATSVSTPEGVSDSVWQDFQKIRKAKKAPMTETALLGLRKQAQEAGLTLQQALEECCARGWQGFNASWLVEAKKPNLADIARITVPGPTGRDPALVKADEDAKRAAPPPAHIREQMASLLKFKQVAA